MGNAALRDLAVVRDVPFDSLAGSVVAVDAHNWLYKYLTIAVRFTAPEVYTTAAGEEVANLVGVVKGLPKFLEHDVVPVFVFDGPPTPLKADEIAARREERSAREEQLEAARAAGDGIEVARLESQTQRLTAVIQETTRGLFDRLDVPYLEAPAEGEAQCAHMARHDPAVDYAGTDDYDALLFGAPLTLRQLTSSGDPECMDLAATLAEHDVSWEQLVDVGILAGTDFNAGLDGVGPKTALAAVREHGDLWGVLDARGETIPYAERIRELFLQPPVVEGYDLDLDLRPDFDAARDYLVDDWEVPADAVERGLARIEDATVQTGLDRWS